MIKQVPDDELRVRWGIRLEHVEPSGDCPGDEAIWAASRGELAAKRAKELLDHVTRCPSCTESWRMAGEIADQAELSQARPRRSNRAIVWAGALAASILLALVVFPSLIDDGRTLPGAEFRDAAGVEIDTLLDEGTAQPRGELVLRWSPTREGSFYRVELATREFQVLHRSLWVDTTEYRVPTEALSGIDPGATLMWRVDALLPDDTQVASPTFLVKID